MKPDVPPSVPIAAKLATTPKETLQKKTVHNAWLINHLESRIRAERSELDRLLTTHSPSPKRERAPNKFPTSPHHLAYHFASAPLTLATPTLVIPPAATVVSTASPCTPDLQVRTKALTTVDSPVGIMHAFDATASPNQSHVEVPKDSNSSSNTFEMAARGSHWSFAEKERFEIALQKYGPFSWPEIIKTVATRSEKQVKAYAARYRRRKKLAAASRMMALSIPSSPQQDTQAYSREVFPGVQTGTSTVASQVAMLPQRSQACSTDSTAATASAEASIDNNNIVSNQGHFQSRPTIIGSSPCFSRDMIELQTSEDGPIAHTDKVLDSHVLDEAILKAEQAAAPLGVKLEPSEAPHRRDGEQSLASMGDNPSEVDLLFDRALQGELLEDEKPFTTPEVQIIVDNSSLDCISNLFMGDRSV